MFKKSGYDDSQERQDEMEDNTVVLTDEDGNEHQFELVEFLEVSGKEYAVLIPLEEQNEEEEAVILRIEDDDEGNTLLIEIDDDDEWERVCAAWEELLEEEEEEEEEQL